MKKGTRKQPEKAFQALMKISLWITGAGKQFRCVTQEKKHWDYTIKLSLAVNRKSPI